MEKGKTDLDTIIDGPIYSMNFLEFFPILRDSIVGLIFMHINNIAHRDIKPGNIMKMSNNRSTTNLERTDHQPLLYKQELTVWGITNSIVSCDVPVTWLNHNMLFIMLNTTHDAMHTTTQLNEGRQHSIHHQ